MVALSTTTTCSCLLEKSQPETKMSLDLYIIQPQKILKHQKKKKKKTPIGIFLHTQMRQDIHKLSYPIQKFSSEIYTWLPLKFPFTVCCLHPIIDTFGIYANFYSYIFLPDLLECCFEAETLN